MSMLPVKIKETITRFSLLNRGDHVVVAVSGGPDSVCLLSVLHALAGDFNLSLHVAHLDHMFRGGESAAEARFVAELAKRFGLPYTVEKFDVPAYCGEKGLPAQAGAREVRYGFLSRLAGTGTSSRIATGHTASDQAETVLLRLIRGAGLSGLSGIPVKRGNIIRPLLEVSRDEVLEYLGANGLEYVSDSSNEKPLYSRNRIRMNVLPVLQQFNGSIVQTLAAEAALIRDEDEFIDSCARKSAAALFEQRAGAVYVKREPFGALEQALKRRVLRLAAEAAGADLTLLSLVQIDEALAFLSQAQTGRTMQLPGLLEIEREYDRFIVRLQTATQPYSHSLAVPGVTRIPGLNLEVETVLRERLPGGPEATEDCVEENYLWQALFDYDKISAGIKLRNRLPGDWFCPAGMGGKSKKLQDFFVDAKVPRSRRDMVPVLSAGDDILAVAGLRMDQRFQPQRDTKKVLILRLKGGNY